MGNWMREDDESSWWLNVWQNARRWQERAWAPVRLGRGRSVTIAFVLNVTAMKVRLGSIVGQAQQGRLSDVVSRKHAHLSWARWTSRLWCATSFGVGVVLCNVAARVWWAHAMHCNCITIRVWELSMHLEVRGSRWKLKGSLRTKGCFSYFSS